MTKAERKETFRLVRIRRLKLRDLALHVTRTKAAWETARDEAARLFKIAQTAHNELVVELSKPLPHPRKRSSKRSRR